MEMKMLWRGWFGGAVALFVGCGGSSRALTASDDDDGGYDDACGTCCGDECGFDSAPEPEPEPEPDPCGTCCGEDCNSGPDSESDTDADTDADTDGPTPADVSVPECVVDRDCGAGLCFEGACYDAPALEPCAMGATQAAIDVDVVPVAMALGDFDDNGDEELALGTIGRIDVIPNLAEPWSIQLQDLAQADALHPVDLDGDGDDDLVAEITGPGGGVLAMRIEDAVVIESVDSGVVLGTPIAVGDFNGDGFGDLVVAGDALEFHAGLGSGGFATAVAIDDAMGGDHRRLATGSFHVGAGTDVVVTGPLESFVGHAELGLAMRTPRAPEAAGSAAIAQIASAAAFVGAVSGETQTYLEWTAADDGGSAGAHLVAAAGRIVGVARGGSAFSDVVVGRDWAAIDLGAISSCTIVLPMEASLPDPAIGDYDGDGIDEIVVVHPDGGLLLLRPPYTAE